MTTPSSETPAAGKPAEPLPEETIPAKLEKPAVPRIRTTAVGSYPIPEWLLAMPSEQGIIDATRVVFDIQRQAGIDLPTDGELYRFDPSHPDTNGMIEYFVQPMSGVRSELGRRDAEAFHLQEGMGFRRRPAGVVNGALGEGALDLLSDCERAASVAGGMPFKFTVTSPYMLARTLLDRHYHGDFERLMMTVAGVLAEQVRGLPCACLQIDEANISGKPEDGLMAVRAINRVLDAVDEETERAVHLCFGNYGGQVVQKGSWEQLIRFLNQLHCDHLVLEIAHRPPADLEALKDIDPRIDIGIGVVDVKINHVETADEVAKRIEKAEKKLGEGRVRWIHPDCGLWMLKRSIADRKLAALVEGRNKYLGL